MKPKYIRPLLVIFSFCMGAVSSAQNITPADVKKANKDAVVFIKITGSGKDGVPYENSGTGFLVTPTGELFTANHLLFDDDGKPLNNLKITGSPGSRYGTFSEIEIISEDKSIDLMLLKFKGNKENFPTIKICSGYNIGDGDDLISLGFPLGLELSIINGILSNKSGPSGWYQTNVDFAQGYSGGPVFEREKGSVIGIVMGGKDGVAGLNFFLPIHRANNLIKILSSPPPCNPDLNNVSILEGYFNFGQSGYNFSTKQVVSWDSPSADILVSKSNKNSDDNPMFFMPFDAPPYDAKIDKKARSGIIEVTGDSYVNRESCPPTGYTYHWYPAEVGQWYCVRGRDGISFHKLKVVSVKKTSISVIAE